MFIIPYYISSLRSDSKEKENFKLTTAWIFMAKGGAKFWETDEATLNEKEVVELYLNPNGLCGKVFCVKDNIMYFEVDRVKTRLGDFYNWVDFLDKGESIPSDLDVWRPFILVNGANDANAANAANAPNDKMNKDDIWGWQAEVKNTMIQKFCSVVQWS